VIATEQIDKETERKFSFVDDIETKRKKVINRFNKTYSVLETRVSYISHNFEKIKQSKPVKANTEIKHGFRMVQVNGECITCLSIYTKSLSAKKSFGLQADQSYIKKIIAALNPQTGETIIEIGAGRGALTESLIESGANVVAIELNAGWFDFCANDLPEKKKYLNLSKRRAHNISANYSKKSKTKTKLVANLPLMIAIAKN